MSEPTFTTPPPVPSRLSPADFSARMNAFLLYFPTLQGEMSTAIPWMAAAVAKLNNVVAANAWVTGTTYTINQTVWSPSDLQIYKALTGHTSTVDPASDAVNWLLVGGFPASHIDRVDNPHGVTAAQVGALALSGGTMTGVLNLPAGGLNVDGHQAWDAGNHGSGSGLDADLLDGEHGAFYRNAGNLNAGTIPAARLPSIDAAQLEGDNAAFFRNASNLNAGTVPTGRLPASSESGSGIIERATQAEAQAGTDNSRAMTPLRVAQYNAANPPSISTSVGAVNTYAWVTSVSGNTNSLNPGSTVAGSALRYAGVNRIGGFAATSNNVSVENGTETQLNQNNSVGLSGTWRIMGNARSYDTSRGFGTLAVRIA